MARFNGGAVIEDVDGRFARFIEQAPKELRKLLQGEVRKTAFALARRITAKAAEGPDAPHIKDAVEFRVRGLQASVGFFEDGEGGKPSRVGPDRWNGQQVTNTEVAWFNEYTPAKHPFMGVSTRAEEPDFIKRITDALGQIERTFAGGVGI